MINRILKARVSGGRSFAALAFAALSYTVLGLTTQDAMAEIGKTYVTAYSKSKGSQAKAGKYGPQIVLRTKKTSAAKSSKKTTKKGKKANNLPIQAYDQSVKFCSKTYYTSKRGKKWLAAHRRVKHTLVVRKHTAKGKYRVICGTIPKRAAKKAPMKKKTKKSS